jgi:hypothetical protein
MLNEWAVVLVRSIEAANTTYVQAQFRGADIGRDIAPQIARLCAHAIKFAGDAGDDPVVAELAVRGVTVFGLVHDGSIDVPGGNFEAFTKDIRASIESDDARAYRESVSVYVGANGIATRGPYNIEPMGR